MNNGKKFAVSVSNVSKVYRLQSTVADQIGFFLGFLLNFLRFISFKKTKKFKESAVTCFKGVTGLDLPTVSLAVVSPLENRNDSFKSSPPQNRHEFYALKNVSFDINQGESWGFIGVNGSGKSTLLKIISGNLRPSAGRVEVTGKVLILDYGCGLNGDFSGRDNIFYKANSLGLTKKQINERFDSIVEFAEIGEFINQPVRTYSSGMVARLGFAIIAHMDADIIIADEALAVGDVFFVQKCMHFIRSFLERGTFLFVSHGMTEVLSLCKQAVWLEKGELKGVGEAALIAQAYYHNYSMNQSDQSLIKEGNSDNGLSSQNEVVKNQIDIDQTRLCILMDYKIPSLKGSQAPQADTFYSYNNEMVVDVVKISADNRDDKAACILSVSLYDEEGRTIERLNGNEKVTLTIEILTTKRLESPIIGFQMINSSGQVIIADNSYWLTHDTPVIINAKTVFTAEFTYIMPILPKGNYSFQVAIALGDDESNTSFLQILDRALLLSSVASEVQQGLVGVPLYSVEILCESKLQESLTGQIECVD